VGAAARRPLAGYAAGAGAMVLWLVTKQVEPLTPTSFFLRDHLANGRLFGESNWLLAKLVYVLLATVLLVAVLRLVAKPELWRRYIISSCVVLLLTHAGVHWLWSGGQGKTMMAQGETHELSQREVDGGKISRRVVTTFRSQTQGSVDFTTLLDARLVQKGAQWEVERETPVDLTREFELRHLDLEVTAVPASGELQCAASFKIKPLSQPPDQLLFYLASELRVDKFTVNGQATDFSQYGDVVAAKLKTAAESCPELDVKLHYAGKLQLPKNLKFERASQNLLFVTSRWFPSLHGQNLGAKNLFTCRAIIRTPKAYWAAAATWLKEEATHNVFLWETQHPVESVPLCLGRFQRYETRYRNIPLTFCTFSVNEAYARRVLQRSSEVLQAFEEAFGPYPFPQVAIVEHPFQGAGGHGFPSLVTMKPERLAPEHEQRFLDAYVPHELAHLWWGNALPPWIAEGAAVFANFHFLEQAKGRSAATAFLDQEVYAPFRSESSTAPLVNAQGATLYAKGSYLLVMLEAHLGQPAVLDALKTFLKHHANDRRTDAEAQTESMIQTLQRAAGSELNSFVADWTRSVKRFDPAITSMRQEPEQQNHNVTLEVQQLGEISFPLPLRVKLANGKTKDLVARCSGQKEVLEFQTSSPVVSAELDPEHLFLDVDRSNNYVSGDQPAKPTAQVSPPFTNWRTYTPSDGLPGMDVRCLIAGPDRRLFASIWSLEAAVNRRWAVAIYDGRWQRYESKTEPVPLVDCMAQVADGSLWLASQMQLRHQKLDEARNWFLSEIKVAGTLGRGVFRPNPNSDSKIPGSRVYSLLVDSEGKLWLGTDHGASRFDARTDQVRTFGSAEGLTGQEVFALVQNKDGTIWAGTEQGVFSYQDGAWKLHPGCPRDLILALSFSPDGTLWCGTYRSGLVAVLKEAIRSYSRANAPLPDTIFSCVACDSRGGVWAGTPNGLIHHDGQRWQLFERANSGLPSNRIRCLAVSSDDHVWVGTDTGVTEYTPN
ncbi:MAG TPA: two-component regulator propeller domain-containing protein, partial [Clostridia bacterium]|nr:two-component regulator propeller domain-containing protein [Clostridia bacterium]